MIFNKSRCISQSLVVLTRTFTTKLPEELKSLQEMCRSFSKVELKPVATQLDRECKYPERQIKMLGQLGLMGVNVSSEYAGSNMNTLAMSLVVEELSQGHGSTGAIVSIHNCLYASLVNRLGTNYQKSKYLKPYVSGEKVGAFALSEYEAGSDVSALKTTARKDGDFYMINGGKAWVTSALEAEACIVFATLDRKMNHKGITAFIVDMNAPGVQVGQNERKLGLKATSTCAITLNNVQVPAENLLGTPGEGFKIAMEQLDVARIGIASLALGIAQASLETAIDYASQRIAFKKPIMEMTSVQNRLAEMSVRIEASRLLVRQAAEIKDRNEKSTKFTSMAKWHASETSTFCSHNCIQILGGMGVVEDLPAERYYRDARITEIFGGITDVQKLIIANQLKKEFSSGI